MIKLSNVFSLNLVGGLCLYFGIAVILNVNRYLPFLLV